MLEIIIFIIIILAVTQSKKKKGAGRPKTPPFTSPSMPLPTAQPGKSAPKKTETKTRKPVAVPPKSETPVKERTFVEPTKPYRAAYNAGERYEDWMPVPDGKKVCRCGYCGADNLIPKSSDPKNYTCYFCREEL